MVCVVSQHQGISAKLDTDNNLAHQKNRFGIVFCYFESQVSYQITQIFYFTSLKHILFYISVPISLW